MALEKINVALLHLLCIRNRHVSVGGGIVANYLR